MKRNLISAGLLIAGLAALLAGWREVEKAFTTPESTFEVWWPLLTIAGLICVIAGAGRLVAAFELWTQSGERRRYRPLGYAGLGLMLWVWVTIAADLDGRTWKQAMNAVWWPVAALWIIGAGFGTILLVAALFEGLGLIRRRNA